MDLQTHTYEETQGYCFCPKKKHEMFEDYASYKCTCFRTGEILCPKCENEFWVMRHDNNDEQNVWCTSCDCEAVKMGNYHYKCPKCSSEKAILVHFVECFSGSSNCKDPYFYVSKKREISRK